MGSPPTGGHNELVDKPGSVLDDHSSATNVTVRLKRPTRIHRGSRYRIPIWSCSGRGLPSPRLLPTARCALTAPFHPYLQAGGFLSVALSVGSRPPGVTWHSALWSPDFPPPTRVNTIEKRSPNRLAAKPTLWRCPEQVMHAPCHPIRQDSVCSPTGSHTAAFYANRCSLPLPLRPV